MTSHHFFLLAIVFSFLFSSSVGDDDSDLCVYSLYVQTGRFIKAGTDSKITVALSDKTGKSVWIPELRDSGLMGQDHDYFEGGNLDIFSVRGPCLRPPLCRITVSSDGSGRYPGWFCDFIEVTFTGPHKGCSQSIFYVEQWLVGDDLTAVLDMCDELDDVKSAAKHLVVRKPNATATAASAS